MKKKKQTEMELLKVEEMKLDIQKKKVELYKEQ